MIATQEVRTSRWAGKSMHFVGVCGSGMSALARMLLAEGARVTGSDCRAGPVTQELEDAGAAVAIGHAADNLPPNPDIVVASAAVPQDNVELRAAERLGALVWKYARLLGEVSAEKECVAISGAHGKTSTTGLMGFVLQQAGMDPSVIVGGRVPQIGGSHRLGHGPHFVVEACEFDRSFLNLRPTWAVINNVDDDHLDFFGEEESLVEAFCELAGRVDPDGLLLVNGDDDRALLTGQRAFCEVETFGAGSSCHWRYTRLKLGRRRADFAVTRSGDRWADFSLNIGGEHNVRNALAVIALAHALGVQIESVRAALADFRGVDRRMQRIADVAGVLVLDDYAHHPTEIQATLRAIRRDFPRRRLWCVFQPHQYSRTWRLFAKFTNAFGAADRVIVPPIHSVRDTDADRIRISADDLAVAVSRGGVPAEHTESLDDAVSVLAEQVEPGDVVVTMGAGPVDRVARGLVQELERRPHVATP